MNLQENVKFAAGSPWRRNFLQRKGKAHRCRCGGVSGPAEKIPPRFSLVID
jgi:hypothetical protein